MAYVLDVDNILPNFKPCPFCGKEPVLQVDKRYPKWIKDSMFPVDGYTVICNTRECPIYHADNTWFFRKEDAIIAWNERKEQPQQKTGRWVDDCSCSECAWINDGDDGLARIVTHFNFCPNCGAKMTK